MMTVKEYLRQYRYAEETAQRLRSEYEEEEERVIGIRSTLGGDGQPHGTGISKPTENAAVRLAEKLEQYRASEIEALRVRQEVFDTIRSVPGEMQTVLYERYINLKRWEDIAEVMAYSLRQVYNIHGNALDYLRVKEGLH